jgi:hypothetical protein
MFVSPRGVQRLKRVTLTGGGARIQIVNITEVPVQLALKPRRYYLEVEPDDEWLPGGDPSPWEILVFDPLDYPIQFVANPTPVVVVAPPQVATHAGPFGMAPTTRGVTTAGAPAAARPSGFTFERTDHEDAPESQAATTGRGHLVVVSDDPIAIMELVDESGAPVMTDKKRPTLGTSPLDCPDLKPGHYRVRFKTPDGVVGEKMVIVEAVKKPLEPLTVALTVPLNRPDGLIGAVVDRFKGLEAGEAFTKAVLASAEPTLMSVLSLATEAIQDSQSGTRQPGDPPASPTDPSLPVDVTLGRLGQSIVVLLAVESAPKLPPTGGSQVGPLGDDRLDSPEKVEAYLRSISIRCGQIDHGLGDPKLPEMTSIPGIAGVSFPVEPGPFCLSLSATTPVSTQRVAFKVLALEGRTTRFLLHQEANGRIHALQFLPSFRDGGTTDFGLMRSLDLAQQFMLKGKLCEVAATLEPMLKPDQPDQLDPIVGCLAGHLMIQTAEMDRLKDLADRMVALHPGLPDSYVLRAFYRDANGEGDLAKDDYVAAIKLGFPISAHLLPRLAQAVDAKKIEEPHVDLLKQIAARLVPGALWTAWMPAPDWDGTPAVAPGRDPKPIVKS